MSRSLSKSVPPAMPNLADAAALGRAVRAQRLAAGLRIDDAAALCGVSVTVLSRLENAASGISTKNLFKVLDGLGMALLVVAKGEVAQVVAALDGAGHK